MFSAIVKYTSDRVWQRRFLPVSITLVLIACILLMRGRMYQTARMQPVSLPDAPEAVSEIPVTYTAATLGNQMAIFLDGQSTPLMVTAIDVRTLPAADREALEEGIFLEDEAALTRLLEDFGS